MALVLLQVDRSEKEIYRYSMHIVLNAHIYSDKLRENNFNKYDLYRTNIWNEYLS